MKGYPPMPPLAEDDAGMDPMRAGYAGLLMRMPDALGLKVRDGVLLRFDERPSVKNLADWALSLGPAPTFDIRQLDNKYSDGPAEPPAHRSGGMSTPAAATLTVARNAAVTGKAPIPESARAIFRQLQERSKADAHRGHAGPAVTGDWGLEYTFSDGRTERCPAIHSQEEARRRQEDVCRKYSHFQCRVYQKQYAK